jgi:hypothetical protein
MVAADDLIRSGRRSLVGPLDGPVACVRTVGSTDDHETGILAGPDVPTHDHELTGCGWSSFDVKSSL